MALYKVDETTADLTKVAGGTLYADNPIGSILPYGGAIAPSGWMICDGSALSRTTYSELFAVIGTAFGSGDGSTTFNLPDMREAVPKGAGLTGKTVGAHLDADGLAVGEFLDDRVQSHTHTVTAPVIAGSGTTTGCISVTNSMHVDTSSYFTVSDNTGRSGNTTEVKSVGVNYIIKAKMVALPADFMSAVDEAVEEAIDTSNIAKMLPYSFNTTSNIGAFNRQFVYQGHALTWTATHTGRLTLRLLKHGDGYSLYLGNQNGMLDSYDNFFGSDSQGTGVSDASITLSAYVKKGDAIRLESNLPSTTARADTFFCQTGLLAYNNNYD